MDNLTLRRSLKNLDKIKEKELKLQIAGERELIKKDLDEKYRADMVSFEAMAKRLEIEKNRMKELEKELEKQRSKNR